MSADSQVPKWISATVAVLVVLGAISGTYSVINSKLDRALLTQESVLRDVAKLDEYDVYLERKLEALKEADIRSEVEVRVLKENTGKLESMMIEALNELKRMNEVLIRGEKSDAKNR